MPVGWAEGSVRTTGAIAARRNTVEVGSEERSVNESRRQVGPVDGVVGAPADGWVKGPGGGEVGNAVLGRSVGSHDGRNHGQADGPVDLGRRLLRSLAPATPAGGVATARNRAVGAVVAVLLLVCWMLWWGFASQRVPEGLAPSAANVTPSSIAAAATPAPVDVITVHVAGAVARPGLVSVPVGARIADVIAAAGGAARTADVTSINLAAPVGDGEQVVVPSAGGAATEVPGTLVPTVSAPQGAPTDGRIALNHADAATLELLPGVGPVIAAHIVAHRQANGPFQTVEDLLDVPGIGEGKLAALRDLVLVP